MIRKYALRFLILPALFLAAGWYLLQTGDFDGVEFLAFVGTPAAVMVLGWAAVVANEISNRRSERRPQQDRSTKFLFYYPLAPAFYLLVGWGALRAGSGGPTRGVRMPPQPAVAPRRIAVPRPAESW